MWCAYGAAVELIPGSRQATADAAVAAHGRQGETGSVFYASHAWQPFFLQGTKTLAYELWEDLGFAAPDASAPSIRGPGLRPQLRQPAMETAEPPRPSKRRNQTALAGPA